MKRFLYVFFAIVVVLIIGSHYMDQYHLERYYEHRESPHLDADSIISVYDRLTMTRDSARAADLMDQSKRDSLYLDSVMKANFTIEQRQNIEKVASEFKKRAEEHEREAITKALQEAMVDSTIYHFHHVYDTIHDKVEVHDTIVIRDTVVKYDEVQGTGWKKKRKKNR